MIYYVLLAIHLILFSWAFYNILYFGVKPSKSLSWILITLLFPFLGVFTFILFGINRRKIKYFELRESKKRKKYLRENLKTEYKNDVSNLESIKAKKISNLIFNNTKAPLKESNKITILKSGKEAINELYKALKNAKEFIHLQYYIIEDGKVLSNIIDIIKEKRKENVEVRILYDFLGSHKLKSSTKKTLKEIGMEIYPETPFRFGSFLFSVNYRNYRKIAIIDNKVGFAGGVNISDNYVKEKSDLGIWEDAHIKIEGCAVQTIHKSFLKDYYYATNKDLSKEEKYTKIYDTEGKSKVQIVSSGPDYEQSVVMQQYLSFIMLAEKSVNVLNPYFIPTFSILEAFKTTALSGVEVNLVLPKKSDSNIATYSMYSYFETLLKAGANIYLRDDFSHSKVIFIDDDIVSIGSTNFDCRSFEHNYELNLIAFDKGKVKEVNSEFEKQKNAATKIVLEDFLNRSNKQKTLERLSRFLSPLL